MKYLGLISGFATMAAYVSIGTFLIFTGETPFVLFGGAMVVYGAWFFISCVKSGE